MSTESSTKAHLLRTLSASIKIVEKAKQPITGDYTPHLTGTNVIFAITSIVEQYHVARVKSPLLRINNTEKKLLKGTLQFTSATYTKDYKVRINQPNLHVRKMTQIDNVYTAIETTLTNIPAIYCFHELLPKTFLAISSRNSWHQEGNFNRELIRRFDIAMSLNHAFLGSTQSKISVFWKFNQGSITVHCNGYFIASTPSATDNVRKTCLNSLEALAFSHDGIGISSSEFIIYHLVVFDLTRTQQASHGYLYSELTNP